MRSNEGFFLISHHEGDGVLLRGDFSMLLMGLFIQANGFLTRFLFTLFQVDKYSCSSSSGLNSSYSPLSNP